LPLARSADTTVTLRAGTTAGGAKLELTAATADDDVELLDEVHEAWNSRTGSFASGSRSLTVAYLLELGCPPVRRRANAGLRPARGATLTATVEALR
jgi:hypothetical protein